jgi:TonB family protein
MDAKPSRPCFQRETLWPVFGKGARLFGALPVIVFLAALSGVACPCFAKEGAATGAVPGTPADGSADSVAPVASDEVLSLSLIETRPKPIRQGPPSYPHDLQRQGVIGGVVLTFVVDEAGDVQDIKAVRYTDERFVKEAVAAVKKWKFKPAIYKGRPVRCRVQQSIPFLMAGMDPSTVMRVLQMNDKIPFAKLENAPKVTEFTDPAKLLMTHRSFTMKLLVAVDVDGSVRDVSTEKQPSDDVEAAVIRALLRWKFEQGIFEGKAVPYTVPVIVAVNPKNPDGTPVMQQGLFERPLVLCVSPALPLPKEAGSADSAKEAKPETGPAPTPEAPPQP